MKIVSWNTNFWQSYNKINGWKYNITKYIISLFEEYDFREPLKTLAKM